MSRAKKLNSSSFGKTEADPFVGRVGLVYARVSSKRQEIDGTGLQSQEGRCMTELRVRGVPYEKSFLDSFTGGGDFMNRPAMRELLSYIDAHPHKSYVVIFDDLKRFARDVEFHIKLRTAFRLRDVTLYCLNYTFNDSPEGKFTELIMAGQAELEKEQNRRQVIQKQRARLELGYWPFCSKKGYDIIKHPQHGKICVPNEQGLTMLKPALEAFANGTLQRKIDVCRFLLDKGFWKKGTKPEKFLDRVTLWLKDCFYAGDIEYTPWEVSRRSGQHQPLISIDTFNQIQRRLNREHLNKRIRIDNSDDFPLRGLIVCADCNGHLTGTLVKGRSGKYPYYLCHTKSCEQYGKGFKKAAVEGQFEALLKRNQLKAEIDPLIQAMFDAVWADELSKIKNKEQLIQQQKKTLNQKLAGLTDLMLNTKSDLIRGAYEKQIEATAAELEELELQSTGDLDLTIPYRTALDNAVKLLKSPYSVWESLAVIDKQKLFYFVFDQKLAYSRTEGYITAQKAYSIRLFEEFTNPNTNLVEMAGVKPASKTGSPFHYSQD